MTPLVSGCPRAAARGQGDQREISDNELPQRLCGLHGRGVSGGFGARRRRTGDSIAAARGAVFSERRDAEAIDRYHGVMVKTHLVVFPGSFDPITYGHLDVIGRGRTLFDELVVAIGRNPGKDALFTAEERLELASRLVGELAERRPELAPVSVRTFSGLTVDFARSIGATGLLRGVRNLSDLQYEVQQAVTNREVAGLETAFVVAGQSFAYTSSSLIRQITAMGQDLRALESMCPPIVIEALRAKKAARHPALERLRADRDIGASG
jgi:pantetheine-phosphate adenylyltransferase